MVKIKNILKKHILFIVVGLVIIAVVALLFLKKDNTDEPKYEPAPPEAPRLSAMGVLGENIDFSPEVRYYEIDLPSGNPIIPEIWATTVSDEVELVIYQAFFSKDATDASARLYLDDGEFKNSYEVKFIKKSSKGFVLQYDDRYTFVPDYTLKEGEMFTFSVESEDRNIEVDANGVVCATGISEKISSVNAYVGETLVDTMTVTKTTKAPLNMFIIAGQGNAAGEGGNADESVKTLPGTAYTAELDDRLFQMKDISSGRQGFTPALAEKWYSLTSEKALFIQTAVSDVSVTKWTADGEAYKMADTRISFFTELLEDEASPYILKKKFCIWLQGEWDIAHGMTAEEYIYYFKDFYNNLNNDVKPDMTAIIPVRSSLALTEGEKKIEPVCAAQYMLGNMFDTLRIITRLTETASIENGFVSEGNLYYTQNGYNLIGSDVAYNLYNCYSSGTDKTVREIELFSNTHKDLFEYDQTVKMKSDDEIRTVTVVMPLYANSTKVTVIYDEKNLSYSEGGVISIAEGSQVSTVSKIAFECGGVDFKLNIEYIGDEALIDVERTTYTWEFNDLQNEEGTNSLSLSERSKNDMYSLEGGVLVSLERQVDFMFTKSIEITSETDWDIEWNGMLNDNSIILGNEFSTRGYIYLAPFAQNMGYSARLVDNDGQTFYLPYREYIESNRQVNSWRINYTKETKNITLYLNGTVVSEYKTEKPFAFTFTNLLGRYGSENVNYCYTGSIDMLRISFYTYNSMVE